MALPNIVEWRHSSATSVRAYCMCAPVGSSSYRSRSIICIRISSNHRPTLASEAASCRDSSIRCSSLSASHRWVP